MINVKNLTFKYNDEVILDDLSFQIEDGDYIAILGKNGSGKSTLMECLLGINQTNGQIFIDNEAIEDLNDFSKIGYVEQRNHGQIDFPITVEEYLSIYSTNFDEISKYFNIDNLKLKNMNALSGGEFQKVKIAKEILNENLKYLFLDEPTTGIDIQSVREINDIFKKLNDNGITIVVITHDFDEIDCHAKKILWIEKKEIEKIDIKNCKNCLEGE